MTPRSIGAVLHGCLLFGAAVLAACTRAGDGDEAPLLVRLVDAARGRGDAGEDAVAIARRAGLARARRAGGGAFAALEPARRIEARGGTEGSAWTAATLDALELQRDAKITLTAVEVTGARPHLVRVTLPIDRAATDRAFAIEWAAPRAAPIDATAVPQLMRAGEASFRTLERAREHDGTAELEVVVTPRIGIRVLAVGLASSALSLAKDARFEVLELDEREAWLASIDTDAARIGGGAFRVAAHGVLCESIVVGVPGSIALPVRVPARSPRFSCEVALFSGGAARASVEVRAPGQEARRRTLDASRSEWTPLAFAFDEFAGKAVEIVLSATAADGSKEPGFVAFGAPSLEGVPGESDVRPDVLLVSVDTLRADSVGPGMPRLAGRIAEFVRFERAIATAPWTLPSHVSMLSGDGPDRHGVDGAHRRIARETPLFADELRRAGYRTLACTGGGWVDPAFGFERGFERFDSNDSAYPDPAWVAERRQAEPSSFESDADCSRSRAALIAALGEARRAPRFMFVHSYVAHNYVAPRADFGAIGAPEAWTAFAAGSPAVDLAGEIAAAPDEAARDRLITVGRARYAASVRVADRWLGDILDALERSGRLDRTIVVIAADHGEELFEHRRFGHLHSLGEEVLHVPLLVRAPGFAPRSVRDVVSLADLAPTLRELCGLPMVFGDGRSVVPLLAGRDLAEEPALAHLARADGDARAIRGTRFKLVESGAGARLFDLEVDPSETDDLAASRPDVATGLAQALAERVRAQREGRAAGVRAALPLDVVRRLREQGYLGGR